MRVRRVVEGEGGQLREIRLRALRDAPEAFGSDAAREAAYGPEVWAERAAGAETVTFVAVDGPRWVGMAAGRPDGAAVRVLGMWVDPSARGTGAGRALLDAVAAWAASLGAERLELSVTDRAPAAAALYRAAGFVATGTERALPGDPPRIERDLHRSLTTP